MNPTVIPKKTVKMYAATIFFLLLVTNILLYVWSLVNSKAGAPSGFIPEDVSVFLKFMTFLVVVGLFWFVSRLFLRFMIKNELRTEFSTATVVILFLLLFLTAVIVFFLSSIAPFIILILLLVLNIYLLLTLWRFMGWLLLTVVVACIVAGFAFYLLLTI